MSIDEEAMTKALVELDRRTKDAVSRATVISPRREFEIVVEAYESAKQPVRIPLEKCRTAAMTAYMNNDGGFADMTDAVLSVVKDAAKEMGVEVEYGI